MTRRIIFTMLSLGTLTILMLATGLLPVEVTGTPASYVDSGECAECHDEVAWNFHENIHGRIRAFEVLEGTVGCTSCHAGADKHVEEGGDPEAMISFSEMSPDDATAQCMKCHNTADMGYWHSSTHAAVDMSCLDCHSIHKKAEYSAAEHCYTCHSEVKATMMLPSHHPVAEGKMNCNSCHNPHGTSADAMIKSNERLNDLCLSCHSALQGPFIFEHPPVVEDCSICHTAHGSVADNLLTENEPYLCMQCHEMHFHAGAKGLSATSVLDKNRGIVQQNPFTSFGWKTAFATKCTQCHPTHHGTDLPSQGITSQGQSFTR
jgi:DmsE family decaheme c-type cytochrome